MFTIIIYTIFYVLDLDAIDLPRHYQLSGRIFLGRNFGIKVLSLFMIRFIELMFACISYSIQFINKLHICYQGNKQFKCNNYAIGTITFIYLDKCSS